MAIVSDELEAYGAGLDEKPRLVALNKIDLVDAELVRAFTDELMAAGAERVFPISGATGKGMDALLDAVLEYLPAATMTERPDGEIEDAEDDYDRLSTREKQVFKLVAEGKTSRDIAKYLGISLKTAMTHRTHIMEKLAMHSRSEIMRYAIRKAIIPPEEV